MSLILEDAALKEKFWRNVQKGRDCWEWQGTLRPDGYGVIWWDAASKLLRTNRLAWVLSIGDIPQGLKVCHKCDNPKCVRPDHLFLGTDADNMDDMRRKGRGSKPPIRYGLKNNRGKLSDEQVRNIRVEYQNRMPKRRHGRVALREELATRYNVSSGHIKSLVQGRQRREV